MIRFVRAVAPLVLVAVFLAGCTARSTGGERVAAATIAPLAGFVSRVAGPAWTVHTIVPPGTSPHVFEPTPRDVRAVASARLVVTVGAGYDGWIRKLAASCASRAVLVDAGRSVGITLADDDEHGAAEHGAHHHDSAENDPHWWLSPELSARALGPIADELARLDPSDAAGFRERARQGAESFRRLETELTLALAPVRGRAFLSAHPAWFHFAGRFGLVPRGSIEPVPGREPSPSDLRALIRTAHEAGLSTLYTEPQFSETAARVVASDAGLRVAMLDPIGGVPGRETYEELLRFNARAFLDGLGRPRRGPG